MKSRFHSCVNILLVVDSIELTAKYDVFIGSVITIVAAVTRLGSSDTLAVATLKFMRCAVMFAYMRAVGWFITRVSTVIVSIAIKQLSQSSRKDLRRYNESIDD